MRRNAAVYAPAASALFMGLGQTIVLKQYLKGALLAVLEIAFLLNANTLFKAVRGLITLGDSRPDLPVRLRDNSTFMMLDGLIAVVIVVFFIIFYAINIVDARKQGKLFERTGEVQTTRQFLKNIGEKAFAYVGLSPAIALISFFVIIPLVYAVLLAFTNFSAPGHLPPNNTVDWVGLETFREMASLGGQFSRAFLRTSIWTFQWALLCTLTTYFGGLFIALALNDKKIRIAKVFRTIFILPYAVPGAVMLFVWANVLNGQFGPLTKILRELGAVEWLKNVGVLQSDAIPWLSDPTMARIMLILVNLWLGFPYFMMMMTGIMTSMPADIFEAATIDGADKFQKFRYITLPLLLYQTIPLMILSFSYNMNNFGGVYFLTQGNPSDNLTTGTFAGSTDTLMTWMYKLAYDTRIYNKASVIAICMFLVIAPFAIYNFAQTKSFKEGEL
ncbi:MAG: sugar ABC transporter permease [Clostridiaceae bacterium]|nr:sugar ABC transporter permease [Clostridiaceae bacterium]